MSVLTRIYPNDSTSCRLGQRLRVNIYLHRTVDKQIGDSAARTFDVFRRMCGADTLKNVVILTDMWSNPPAMDRESREKDLK